MKPIRPIYVQGGNNSERIAGLIFLLVIACVLLLAGIASAQTASNGAITKACVSKESGQSTEGTLISWNINADVQYPCFLVERSTDKVHYELVSVVKNTGNINANTYFSATDYNAPAETTYYRISEVDSKGRAIYLFKVTVDNSQKDVSQN